MPPPPFLLKRRFSDKRRTRALPDDRRDGIDASHRNLFSLVVYQLRCLRSKRITKECSPVSYSHVWRWKDKSTRTTRVVAFSNRRDIHRLGDVLVEIFCKFSNHVINYRHVWRWKDIIRHAQHGFSYLWLNKIECITYWTLHSKFHNAMEVNTYIFYCKCSNRSHV